MTVTIPNIITLGRLFLVPLAIWLIVSGDHVGAFWIFILAGVSDGVDGFLARQFNMRSVLGSYLDPLADKALLVSIYVTLAVIGDIPVWLTILIVSRDVLIVGGVLLAALLGMPIAMKPHIVSKANTAAQIVLAGLVLADLAFPADLTMFRLAMIYIVGLLTIASALVYVVDWVRHMGAAGAPEGGAAEKGGMP
ncbi:MAG TPA: CDP-alcohol phosphatidyltransferase family protein [Bauldia sp.]|nr:CDP-alcohol phosphatidyltransferase family protein [Bauldia sp.]